ncbi:hypothetical protein ABGV17_04345 [Guyparkeria sp. GHLCS8-2]|uniref:hypothetical protein n=1 Tax=Guyparkeria halopsychrophila TaxID=3139421 RepID=UPI0037C6C10D
MKHKLQLNTTGAWRNVIDFDAENLKHIRPAAALLASIGQAKVQIVDEDGQVILFINAGKGEGNQEASHA